MMSGTIGSEHVATNIKHSKLSHVKLILKRFSSQVYVNDILKLPRHFVRCVQNLIRFNLNLILKRFSSHLYVNDILKLSRHFVKCVQNLIQSYFSCDAKISDGCQGIMCDKVIGIKFGAAGYITVQCKIEIVVIFMLTIESTCITI